MMGRMRMLLMILGCVVFTLVGVWILIGMFDFYQEKIQTEGTSVFREAVEQEVQARCSLRKKFSYDSARSRDNLDWTEKYKWGCQFYLNQKDPTRIYLDSLFQSSVVNQGIQAWTAIAVTVGGKKATSHPDSLLHEATALEEIVFKKDYEGVTNIVLQPYMRISFWGFVRQLHVLLIVGVWLVVIVCFVLYALRNSKKKGVEYASLLSSNVLAVEEKIVPLPILQQPSTEWIQLPCDFLFDDKNAVLKFEEQEILFKGKEADYFRAFIKAENFEMTYLDICDNVYGFKYKEKGKEVEESDKAKIYTAIRRVRKQLLLFSGIRLESVSGKGYQLEFKSEDS